MFIYSQKYSQKKFRINWYFSTEIEPNILNFINNLEKLTNYLKFKLKRRVLNLKKSYKKLI